MTEHVKGVLENLKKAIFNDLDEGLKNQQMMHLPGEGLFLLSDPTFNHRGDLLANLTWNGKVAAAENGENLANLSNEEDIWEPDLSSAAHLPARQQRYVLDDSVPSVFHALALGDLHPTLLEVDEHVAEAQRKGDQEMIQTGDVTKANQEVASQSPAGEDL
ncbi:hypothetical protein Neosp_013518 [[Neocosmospora] mangrovei]